MASTQPAPSKTTSILIVGGGTWGISTALTLARRGYKTTKVLEANPIPSPISAGNDANKIMEEGAPSPSDTDEEYVWSRMHQIATEAWKNDAVFKEFYHATGIVFAAVEDECFENVRGYTAGHEDEYTELATAEDFRRTMPEGVLKGDFPGWRGFARKDKAGWVFARGAMMSAYEEALKLGVSFVTGDAEGKVEELVYEGDRVVGAKTKDGQVHEAEWTVLAAGASGDLIFDFQGQLRPTAWTLAHIQLTEAEHKLFTNLPVLFNAERGFFIEPTSDTHELKFCDEHPGYVNLLKDDSPIHHDATHSTPFARHQIPIEAEQRMRRLLRETLGPDMAEREFCFARVCWDADTVDRQFLIDRHPKKKGLVVAAGGSGNGFMMMPCVGQLIADVLEGRLEKRLRGGLRWRPEIVGKRDWLARQGRFGADGEVMQFKDARGWTDGRNTGLNGIVDKLKEVVV